MMISHIAIIATLICCQAISDISAELTERHRIHPLDKSLRRYNKNNNNNDADHNGDSNDNYNDAISKKSNRIANHLNDKRQLLLVEEGDREVETTVDDEQTKKREMAPHLLSSFWNNNIPSTTSITPHSTNIVDDSSSSSSQRQDPRRQLTKINEIINYMKDIYDIDLIEISKSDVLSSHTNILSSVDDGLATFSFDSLMNNNNEDVVYLAAAAANQDEFALLTVDMNSGDGKGRVQGVARLYNGELVKIQQQLDTTTGGGSESEQGTSSNGRNINSWENSLYDWDTWHNNQLAEVDKEVSNKIVVTPYDGIDLVETNCAELYNNDDMSNGQQQGEKQEEGETNAIHSWSNSLTNSWDSWIEKHQAAVADEINSSSSSSGLNSMKSKDEEDEAASFLQQIQHNKHTNVSPKKKKSDQGHRYKHVHSDNRHLMEEDKISTTTANQQQQVQLYIEIDSIDVQDDDGKMITKNVNYRSILASTPGTTGGYSTTNEEDTGNGDMKCIYIPASAVYGNDISWSGSIIYMKQTTPSLFDSEGTDSGLVLDNGSTSSATTSSPTTSTPSLSLAPSDSTQPSSQPSDSTMPSLSSLPSSQPSMQLSVVCHYHKYG